MLKRTILSGLLFAYFLLPQSVYANQQQPYFQTNFESHNDWESVNIAPSLDPCSDSQGISEWRMYEHGFGAEIDNGQPCYVAMFRPEMPFGPEWMDVTWDSFITDPAQDRNVILHWKDEKNFIHVHFFENWIYLRGSFNGQQIAINNSPGNYPFKPNRTYSFRVRENRHNGNFKVWVNSVLVIETNIVPARFIPARPGIGISVGDERKTSHSYFSNFTIWNTPEKMILQSWKQTAEPWADLEYDSAKKWSPNAASIARWGCAMTSAAIILDSVGVKHLPSGEQLNPGTLNSWLKSQPDGYLGAGFLNWRAIARLAKWHSEHFGSTSLEFSAAQILENEQHSWLRQKMNQRIPVILEQPGHFVVASNWDSATQDFDLLDPAFSRDKLADYQSKFVSARVFTPSATNLQGGTLLLPKWATPILRTSSGLQLGITPLENKPYGLEDSPQTEWQLWDIPTWGDENLTLTIDSPVPVTMFGALYDEVGAVSSVPHFILPNTATPLDSSETPIDPQVMSDQTIATLLSWGDIKTPAIWLWRQKILSQTPEQKILHQQNYTWLLKQAKQNDWLTEVGWELLSAEIPALFSP